VPYAQGAVLSEYVHTCLIRGDGGRSLIPPALALAGWAIEHVPQIEAGRVAYERR
jgi:DNA-binding HxlR family transcriptional regulator